MAVNATSVFLGTTRAASEMAKTGGGSVVNISSIMGFIGGADSHPGYSASKGAVRIFTKSAAVRFGPSGVRVNTNGNTHFPREEPLVTRRLADAGYTNGLIGKLHLAGACYGREARVDDGYDFFRYSHAPRPDWPKGHDYHDWLVARGEDPFRLLRVPDYRDRTGTGAMEPTPERDNVPPLLHQTTCHAWLGPASEGHSAR